MPATVVIVLVVIWIDKMFPQKLFDGNGLVECFCFLLMQLVMLHKIVQLQQLTEIRPGQEAAK